MPADITRKINFVAGESSAIPLIDRVNTAITKQATGLDRLASLYAKDTQRFEASIHRQMSGMEMLARARNRDTQKFEADVNSRIQALKLEEAQIERIGGTYERSSPDGTTKKSGPGAASVLSGVSELFSGTEVGRIANAAGDIARLAEQVPKLQDGFAGLLTTAAPLALGLGAAVLAFGALTDAVDKNRKAADEAAQSAIGAARAQSEAQALLARGDLEGYRSRIEALQEAKRTAETDLATVEGLLAETSNSNFAIQILGQTLFETNPALEGLNSRLSDAQKAVLDADAAIESFTGKANEAAAAQLQYTDQLAASSEAIRQLFEQGVELRSARTQSLDDRAIDAQIASARAKITADNKAADEAEDLQLRQQQASEVHQDRLLRIETSGAARIENLRQSLYDRESQTAAKISELSVSTNKDRIKAEGDFNRESQRLEREHRIALRRLTEDANANIRDLIRGGQFAEAKAAQEKRDLDKARIVEDFNAERAERSEDFTLRRAESEAATKERIAQLQAELTEYRNNTQVKIDDEQRVLAESLAAAQADYENDLTLDARRREIQQTREERDRDLREQWAREDEALRNEREERAFNAQMQRIEELQAAEFERIKEARAGIDEIQAAQEAADAEHLAKVEEVRQAIANLLAPFSAQSGPVWIPPYGSGLIGPASAPGPGLLPLPPPPDPFGFGNFFNQSSIQPLSAPPSGAESRFAVNINTAGMMDGLVVGNVPTTPEVESMVAQGQEQVAVAMRSAFSQLTRGRI